MPAALSLSHNEARWLLVSGGSVFALVALYPFLERAWWRYSQWRLDRRLARGHDSYFEELRSLQAYTASKPAPIRVPRLLAIATGAGLLFAFWIFLADTLTGRARDALTALMWLFLGGAQFFRARRDEAAGKLHGNMQFKIQRGSGLFLIFMGLLSLALALI